MKTTLRNVRQPGGSLPGSPDLFERHEIVVALSRTSDLHTLREYRLASANEGIRGDYQLFAIACYFTRLIEVSTEPEHPVPELFDLLSRALDHLSKRPAQLSALPAYFERRLASLLGVLGKEHSEGADALRAAGIHLPRQRDELIASLREPI